MCKSLNVCDLAIIKSFKWSKDRRSPKNSQKQNSKERWLFSGSFVFAKKHHDESSFSNFGPSHAEPLQKDIVSNLQKKLPIWWHSNAYSEKLRSSFRPVFTFPRVKMKSWSLLLLYHFVDHIQKRSVLVRRGGFHYLKAAFCWRHTTVDHHLFLMETFKFT